MHPLSRRELLVRAGLGFGGLAFTAMSAQAVPKKPHIEPKAKSVIWCFMDGGPSHLDLFDPKPALTKLAGKPLPPSFRRPITAMGNTANTPLLASQRTFKQHGKSGLWVSDWYPEIAKVADELCVVRSCIADGLTHVSSMLQMNTCSLIPGRPCLGAWTMYGLGSECDNLPGFVVLADTMADPPGGSTLWGNGFLPSSHQGTRFADGDQPLLYATPPNGIGASRQRGKFDFINDLNRRYATNRTETDRINAQINAYELAYRMQSSAPEIIDFTKETPATKTMYGLDQTETAKNGRNCLLARRLVERGVRFVQLYMGAGSVWDAHSNLEVNHSQLTKESDKPIAGLIRDLKQRGLLDDTLVIWGGEFGRTSMSESGNGRDHNPYGFTMFFAGGGVKPGFVYGATDEIGLYAIENASHVRDIHATILHLLGMNDKELTFLNNGREEYPTAIGGKVMEGMIA